MHACFRVDMAEHGCTHTHPQYSAYIILKQEAQERRHGKCRNALVITDRIRQKSTCMQRVSLGGMSLIVELKSLWVTPVCVIPLLECKN